MRRTFLIAALVTPLGLASAAVAAPTAQTTHGADTAKQQGLTGAQRADFMKSCQKGPLAATKPTAPTAPTKESQAVTKPSGVDRNTRAAQCQAEADRRGLAAKDRKQFQLSCIATAGPVTEGETGTSQPKPGKAIKGIGVNNYKPDAKPAKSSPDPAPPAAAKPRS